MKVRCKPGKREIEAERRDGTPKLWTEVLPFNVNPRGVLIHRVRSAKSHFQRGKYSHDSVSYWCGNGGCGVDLTDNPPADRLLCARCEIIAVAHGEPTADVLAGRHICTGVMRAHRLC